MAPKSTAAATANLARRVGNSFSSMETASRMTLHGRIFKTNADARQTPKIGRDGRALTGIESWQSLRAECRVIAKRRNHGFSLHTPESDQKRKAEREGLRGMFENGRHLGAFADVPGMRARRLLRFVEE